MLLTIGGSLQTKAQPWPAAGSLDVKVKAFLDGARHEWREQNVPYEDGQILYKLIVQIGPVGSIMF